MDEKLPVKDFELVEGWVCENGCPPVLSEDLEENPLYECGDCGTTFTRDGSNDGGHQCPNCYKFAARIGDHGCPDCGEAELEQEDLFQCRLCSELFADPEEDQCQPKGVES